MSDYGVYVIQLKSETRPLDHPPLPAVYVGQSWHSPEDRFEQHQSGDLTGSRKIRGRCRFLRPELYADIPRVPDQAHSIELEEGRARRLTEAGFTVICNGEMPRWPRGRLREFDAYELRAIEPVLRNHVAELDRFAGRALNASELERILTWDATVPSIRDLLPGPTELAGRYRHVTPSVLRACLTGRGRK